MSVLGSTLVYSRIAALDLKIQWRLYPGRRGGQPPPFIASRRAHNKSKMLYPLLRLPATLGESLLSQEVFMLATGTIVVPSPAKALPGARTALIVLILINLFNYI